MPQPASSSMCLKKYSSIARQRFSDRLQTSYDIKTTCLTLQNRQSKYDMQGRISCVTVVVNLVLRIEIHTFHSIHTLKTAWQFGAASATGPGVVFCISVFEG